MGLFTDALDSIGLGDVGSSIVDFFDPSSSSGGLDPSQLAKDDTGDLTLGGDQFSNTDPSGGGSGGSSSGGGFGAKALGALGGAAISTAGAAVNPIKVAPGVTPHYLNNVNPDSRSQAGKAQRAPVADPAAIWAQWEKRLQYFAGTK